MEKIPANSRDRNGFTRVEMTVALFIFAMLSVAGVIMLRSAVDSDEITAENLGQMAEMQRFVSLLEAELSQALPRTYREIGRASWRERVQGGQWSGGVQGTSW